MIGDYVHRRENKLVRFPAFSRPQNPNFAATAPLPASLVRVLLYVLSNSVLCSPAVYALTGK